MEKFGMDVVLTNLEILYQLINGSGKYKEYNDNNILKLEGEYLNGKKH